MTQLLAWAATLLGWAGTWTVGNGRRYGWLIGVAACTLWVAVNAALGLTAGIVSAIVAGSIAGRNWRMALRPCIVCGEPTTRARCPAHALTDRRPTRHQRGYGTKHDARAHRLRALCEANPSRAICALCGQPIDMRLRTPDPASFAAHHETRDRTGPLHPSHRICNIAAGRPEH